MEARFSPGMVVRSHEHIRHGDDAFQFLLAKTNGLCNEQIGRHIQLNRGEATLIRGDEPRRTGSAKGFKCALVIASKAEFEARNIHPGDAVMRRLPSSNETLALLQAYLRALGTIGVQRVIDFSTPTSETVHGRHILDLIALAVSYSGAVGESTLGAVAAARLQTALDYIAAHFNDPQLTFEMVAKSQGISVPYLRDLMGASGRCYVDVVNELRLQKAFNELTTAEPDKRTILQIAMAAGFSDISHFNRRFRARFGDTPSGVRGQSRQRH
ncbi:MAG: AraC family transcriptional regulator [Polyangiaceae bacterium]|nr:AraC family transcriptional regulator [Polyangiaceae bacterium]